MSESSKIRNVKLASSIEKMEEASNSLSEDLHDIAREAGRETLQIEALESRLQALANRCGISLPPSQKQERAVEMAESQSAAVDGNDNFRLDNLSEIDVAVACVAGGLGVLIDFLVVRIPKSTNISRNGISIYQEGSPLTGWMRKIGFESDGKTSKWVEILEKWFGVNYDTSTIKGEKGFCPRTHRIYSLAHDPSPSGLLWAIKDMVCGTFSYIDHSGKLKILAAKPNSLYKILAAPIVWIGHIISDIFTKAGVPLPGSCFLRTLQFGSFGAKKRTIGQVIEYMYLEGYDLRHLATMGLVNACVEIIIRIYNILTKPRIAEFGRPAANIQADREMLRHRLHKMIICGYAVAAAGNVAKLAAYKWNPTAFNAPVWLAFARASLSEYEYQHSFTNDVLDAMELRAEIENNFDRLQQKLNQI